MPLLPALVTRAPRPAERSVARRPGIVFTISGHFSIRAVVHEPKAAGPGADLQTTRRMLECLSSAILRRLVVPQFEIRLLRPQASPRQQENASEHDKYEARPIRFQSKPGTRPTRLQSHWLGRLHCCVTWCCRRSSSSRFAEPPSPDRLSRYE